jgi:Ser/Thr protein kinase RdoA (MazF antagonist)
VTPHGWAELAELFSLGTALRAPAHVTRGAMGDVWRLETSRGRWAVKLQFPWAPAEPRPADVGVQMAAAAAGIKLPLPVLTPAGDAVVPAGGQHVRVYEWADLGQPIKPPAGDRTAAEIGRLLGTLHGLALTSPEPDDPWYTAVPPPHGWTALQDRAAAAGLSWAGELANAHDRIGRLSAQAAAQPPAERRIVCHRDFSPDNVVPSADRGHLVVLDWENAGPLDPRCELGYVLFAWSSGNGRVSAAAISALLGGYTAAADAAAAPGPVFTTAIAATLNYLYAMADQALTDPGQASYAGEQVSALLQHSLLDLALFLDAAPPA